MWDLKKNQQWHEGKLMILLMMDCHDLPKQQYGFCFHLGLLLQSLFLSLLFLFIF